MKSRILPKLALGLGLVLLPLAGGCLQQSGIPSPATASVTSSDGELEYVDAPEPASDGVAAEQTVQAAVSDAPAQPVSTEKPLPLSIRPTEALSDFIRIAESGVDERVLLAYATNSLSRFSLGPEEIIYLNDIGVPAAVVAAMLQHDHLLFENFAQPPAPPVVVGTPPEAAIPAPSLLETAPPQDYLTDSAPAPATAGSPDTVFYDALTPYGAWVDIEGYGRCWQPSVEIINPAWQPYCDRGHWVYSDCGWYWLSDYSWGWAPFHYGRWFRHNGLGWCWAPDTVWGPSWVSWRYSNDYCGWAPLPPAACFRPGAGFTYFGRPVGFSFDFGLAANCYTFVPVRNFCDNRLSRFTVARDQVARIYKNTVVTTQIVNDHSRIINHGIPAERIAAATHSHIRQVVVRETSVPAAQGVPDERIDPGGRTLTVLRPHLFEHPRSPTTIAERPRTEPQPSSGGTAWTASAQPAAANPPIIIRLPDRPLRYTPTPASQERTAPLIIRGPNRAAHPATMAESSPNHFSRVGVIQNVQPAATTPSARAQTQSYSSWTAPHSVQAPSRFERQQPIDHPEPLRTESGNRWSAAPPPPAPEPNPRHYSAPVYQPPAEALVITQIFFMLV